MEKGFFGSLFDLTFEAFVTIRIIKVLYIIAILASGLFAIGVLVSLIQQGGFLVVVAFIAAPIAFFGAVLLSRIYLEIVIVLFRIAENTGQTEINTRKANTEQ